MIKEILETLRVQRWDDHRYYHHSRINQSLHFISAISFMIAYIYLFIDPVVSAYVAWLIAMTSRQCGHFFFEPKDYDTYNQATQEYKEEIKKIIFNNAVSLSRSTAFLISTTRCLNLRRRRTNNV